MFFRLLRKLLSTCLLLLFWAVAQAAPTPAGTVISSTATATYVDSATGLSVRLVSNTVNTTVSRLEALTLVAGQNLLIATGAPFTISHTLTNTGNSAASYLITAGVVPGSVFTPVNVRVVQDGNGNGLADAGEPVVPAGGTITLATGLSAGLLITGQVPAGANPGQTAQLMLRAVSQLQGATASNTDTLNLTNGAAVQVTLAASSAAATPGAPVSFTATAVNNGNVAASATASTVNGAPANLFLLRVPVPANTTFAAAQVSPNAGAQTLYHVLGSPANSYLSTVPAGAVVDVIAWGIASLPQNGNLQGQFSVAVNANAAGTVSGTAYADWTQQGAPLTTASNTVVLPLPARSATIGFYNGASYAPPPVTQVKPGNPLFVQADAAVCNADPAQIGTVPVTVTSQLTGDTETFTAVETGPNTGVFRIQPNVPTANAASHIVASGDGILEVLRNDTITATLTACGGVSMSATTTLLIDPSGVVYNSTTNQPVAGATVQLIDVAGSGNGGNPGGPAVVFAADGATPAPSVVVTAADGRYAFPLLPPSTYKLVVTPPAGYAFPSKLPPALQPAGRIIDAQGSYGGSFSVGIGASVPVFIDLPLDAGATGALFIQKTANKTTAELGDFVDYSIRFNNVTAAALPGTVLSDMLPAGFAYVRGTARLNGALLPDPTGGSGPSLQFALGSIAVGSQPTLSYRVRVGVGSQGGTGINTAQAASGAVQSNRSSARVQVVGGVFSSKAYIIGKVFADCRRDGVQDAGEPGVPGVRIYLEDGTYAVTDEEGKYSFYGLEPRTHVAKVDSITLPAGATLQVLNNRNAMDPASRFVDLTNGELHKADFAIAQCTPGIREQLAARRKAMANPSEILQAAGSLLSANKAASAVDTRTLPSSGTRGLPGASASAGTLGAVGDPGGPFAQNAQGLPTPVYTPASTLMKAAPSDPAASRVPEQTPHAALAPGSEPLENLLPELSPEVGFVGLRNEQVLPGTQTRVRVKGPLGAMFELSVNGQSVPASQVGKKSSLEKNAVLGWEYIGVDLKPGRNTLDVRAVDGFGNARGSAQLTVLAPGPLEKIGIEAPAQPVADGATALAIGIFLRDAQGLPVAARTQLTLQASLGQWQTPDLDPRQPGTQVFVEGGEGRFLLLPPAQPGKAELSVSAGTVKSTSKIEFTPNLRPMIAAGIVAGTINLRNLNPSALQPAQSSDVFERQIQSASRGFDNGKGNVAARTALFLKGKVLGSTLLTLAYDSDKPSDTALFRDIQPHQFYPVYGDSSARGFEAQSTGKLYVMMQNGTNYALLGDYATQSDHPARQLTQYSRALNGVKARLQEGPVTVEGFASRTSTTQVVQEFRANGTSGPFRLNLNGVVNSQQVNVITRDRNQASVIVKDVALARFTDYEIEAYTGQLLLKSPVPSVDPDLNPVFIRVSYSVDTGGPQHSVAGADARLQITPGLTLGATAIRDTDPVNRQNLMGVNLSAKLGEKTVATGEAARSRTDLRGSGAGQRVEIRHEGQELQARVWGVRTDAGFYNTSSTQSAGQSEYGAKIGYTLDPKNRLVGEALKTSNSVTGAEQTGVELKLERSLPGNAKLEVGARYSSANAQSALSATPLAGTSTPVVPSPAALAAASPQVGYTSARVKLTVPVPDVPQADVYGLAEYAIDGSGGREIGVGGNYAINPTTKLYVRHDFINSLNGPYTLSPAVSKYTTVAGLNTELSDSTQLFNEYRMGDSINGRSSEAAIGLRKLMRLSNGIGLSASVQRIKPISGAVTDDSSAVTVGADYTAAATWKASGQLQWQTSTTSRSWLLTGALANKLDENWTLLNRGLYSVQTSVGTATGERKLITAQSGIAYRPVDSDVWNALGRIEYKRDEDSTLGPGLKRNESGLILSTHLNVQPTRSWAASARYAVKRGSDRSNGISSRSLTQLIGGRSSWDLTERWDIGVQAYRMWGNGAAETAVGVEVGYLAWKNLWLSMGYNVKGFRAPDLTGEAYTQRGLYLRMRFKFDENLFESGTKINQ
ncbi:SdrD B-like domain-containing protein [Polaromonas sp.]|uniref:SdrD B-like domain-containing protein n=1 Tax=Polaromonas sp. TaxID=1869339 RepID=UPI002FC970B0